MNDFFRTIFFPRMAFEAAGEGTPAAGSGSFFQAGSEADIGQSDAGDTGQTQTGDTGTGEAAGGERPEWLMPKYTTVEDQAKAYKDLYGAYSKKTGDLKAEVATEYAANYAKEIGVPDEASGYEYPEGVNAPGEDLDKGLRNWSKANNIGPEAFQSLVNDVWMKTHPDPAAELESLGKNAETRIENVNKWVNANIDKAHFGAVGSLMTTAAGVELVEALADMKAPKGFAPDGENTAQAPLTRDAIRQLQADPKYGTDEAYTQMVSAKWRAFAKQQGG